MPLLSAANIRLTYKALNIVFRQDAIQPGYVAAKCVLAGRIVPPVQPALGGSARPYLNLQDASPAPAAKGTRACLILLYNGTSMELLLLLFLDLVYQLIQLLDLNP